MPALATSRPRSIRRRGVADGARRRIRRRRRIGARRLAAAVIVRWLARRCRPHRSRDRCRRRRWGLSSVDGGQAISCSDRGEDRSGHRHRWPGTAGGLPLRRAVPPDPDGIGRCQHGDLRRRRHRIRPSRDAQDRAAGDGGRRRSSSIVSTARFAPWRRSPTPTSPPSTTGARRAYGAGSAAYVVIERLAGGSMRDLLDRGRRLTPSQALVIGLDACRALDHAHRRGFVHGELTPSKLVFGDDRRSADRRLRAGPPARRAAVGGAGHGRDPRRCATPRPSRRCRCRSTARPTSTRCAS